MLAPNYSGPKTNHLTRREGVDLTIALGAAHIGNDYENADVYGEALYFDDRSSYRKSQVNKNPETYRAKVEGQIERLQEIIAPFIGRWAAAKHNILGLKNGSTWDLWEASFGYTRPGVLHTSGIILGISGIAMNRRMVFHYDHPEDLSKAHDSRIQNKNFKIGVELDTSHNDPVFSYGVEAPDTDRMLVPVRGFPVSERQYHGIWSHQISGSDYEQK